MPALDEILQQKLKLLEAKHQRRILAETEPGEGVRVRRGNREFISFSSNDYLGLSRHPEVIKAAEAALKKYGAGAGASRLVTGNHPLYSELEQVLAKYKNTESSCVFGSGYLANLGAVPALVGKNDLILADRLSHACMLDAAKISDATLMRFAHNNVEHCRMLLEANRKEFQHCLIITETVFSMDGDRAPIKVLAALAKEFDAWLLTDDAHGFGFPSPLEGEGQGGGQFSKDPHPLTPSLKGRGDILMGTLSKAAGSYGGYICGSKTLVDYLKTAARSVIYSTALPPATVAASIAAIRVMQKEKLGEKALENARYFTMLMGLEKTESAIVPVIVKDTEKALKLAETLEKKGFLVVPIRPPTVPENTARLRFAFTALHEKSQIESVAKILQKEGLPLCEPSH